MSEKNGGPAFPSGKIDVGSEWADFPYLGMSLRDYFAGQAMLALVSVESVTKGDSSIRIDAARCYRFADAMLAEREK